MSSSDSSDDEEMQKFKEAADPLLLNDDMFQNNCKQKDNDKINASRSKNKSKSQRNINTEEEHYNDINISEATQKYIGKKLTQIIEKQIKFVEKPSTKENTASENDDTFGVKLLSDSKYTLLETEETEIIESVRKKPKMKKFDNQLNEDNCRQVAISGYDILSKNDIKHWSNRSKAEIYHYHKNNKHDKICTVTKQ